MNIKAKRIYIIYDGRARYDTDAATVLETCDSLKEAIKDCEMFSYSSGPIDFDPVVYSYDTSGNYLTDKRLEYDHEGITEILRSIEK